MTTSGTLERDRPGGPAARSVEERTPDTPGPHRMRGRDWLLVLAAIAPVVALAVVAVVQVGHGYLGVSDNAMTELRIRNIGTYWPLIGPFSRDGWSHPGPALFYLLYLPFRLTGSRSNGMLVGATVINGAAIAGMVVLARRWGGTVLALLVALGCLLLISALGLEFVWDPWNPFVTVLPFGLVVLATWAVTCGDAWSLPVLAGVGSFCAQTHVAYVPLVGILGAVAVVSLAVAARRSAGTSPGPGLRAPIIVTAGILGVFWLAPVIQQATSTHGNLRAILDYFAGTHATKGLHVGYNVVTRQFAWNPDWLFGLARINPFNGEPAALGTAALPFWWLALGGALAIAWRRGQRSALRFGTVLVIIIVTSLVAIARTIGTLYEYRLRFVWVLGMLTVVFVVWVLWLWLTRQRWFPGPAARVAGIVAIAGIVVLSAGNVAKARSAALPSTEWGRIAASLARQLHGRLPPHPGVALMDVRGTAIGPGLVMTGIMVDLERHGIPVAVYDGLDDRLRFGTERLLGHRPVRAQLRIVVDDQIERVAAHSCAQELAYWGRTGKRRRAEDLATIARTNRELAAGRISGREAIRRIVRVSDDLHAFAVFETPPTRPGRPIRC